MKTSALLPALLLLLALSSSSALAGDDDDPRAVAHRFASPDPDDRAAADRVLADASPEFLHKVLAALRKEFFEVPEDGKPVPIAAPEGTPMVMVETKFLEVDEATAATLGSPTLLAVPPEAQIEAALKSPNSKVLSAPTVTVLERQKASITIVDQTSFIEDYDVEHAKDGTTVANPVVGVVTEGIVLDLRTFVSADRKYVTCDVNCSLAHLQRPIREVKSLLGKQEVTIQLPELRVAKKGAVVTVPKGRSALLPVGRSPKDDSRLLFLLLKPSLQD